MPFFDDEKGQANILQFEQNSKITKKTDIDVFGQDFETIKNGFVDFLLLDENGFIFVVLKRKKEEKIPWTVCVVPPANDFAAFLRKRNGYAGGGLLLNVNIKPVRC